MEYQSPVPSPIAFSVSISVAAIPAASVLSVPVIKVLAIPSVLLLMPAFAIIASVVLGRIPPVCSAIPIPVQVRLDGTCTPCPA